MVKRLSLTLALRIRTNRSLECGFTLVPAASPEKKILDTRYTQLSQNLLGDSQNDNSILRFFPNKIPSLGRSEIRVPRPCPFTAASRTGRSWIARFCRRRRRRQQVNDTSTSPRATLRRDTARRARHFRRYYSQKNNFGAEPSDAVARSQRRINAAPSEFRGRDLFVLENHFTGVSRQCL